MAGSIKVIGMAGGIGSGKSRVAAEFAKLGCVVSDSDAEAKAALADPEVMATLIGWWGPEVCTPAGAIDRSAVARVVFADPAQRARLEGLIHPRLHAARAELLAKARNGELEGPGGSGAAGDAGAGMRAGVVGVVIDAPLLFEAGIQDECDAVVYVDCPREERLRRVQTGRGWSEEELDRREKAQLPLDVKRSRSDYVVVNDGRSPLAPQVQRVLGEIVNDSPPLSPASSPTP